MGRASDNHTCLWEMSLEGETWGMEVEPSCLKCGSQDLSDLQTQGSTSYLTPWNSIGM